MHFSLPKILALLSAPLIVYAQSPNPFKIPVGGLSATGGQPLNLEWTPTTEGTISLILRSGQSNDLAEGTIIASKIDNSGSYTWTPSNSITKGNDYTIEIVDDANPNETNYTPYFTLDTTTTETKSMSKVDLGAPSSKPVAGSVSTVASTSTSFVVPIHNTFTDKTATTGPTMSGSASASGSAVGTTASSPTTGGAARMTAIAAGMFGVALGALAL